MSHPSSSRRARHQRSEMPTETHRSSTQRETQHSQLSKTSAGWELFLSALKVGINGATQHGKELSGPLQSYHRAGKLIPRLINPFLDLNSVFMYGLVEAELLSRDICALSEEEGHTSDQDMDDENEEQSPKDLHLSAYNELLRVTPRLEKTLKRLCRALEGEDYAQSLLKDLVDVIPGLKYLIPTLTLPLPEEKSARGFHDFNTGLLICPARHAGKYNDEFRLLLRDGRIEVTAHDFPVFMYDNTRNFQAEHCDGDILKGLCRGPLLISACQHMLFGSGIEKADMHATKDPIAKKFGISSITPPLIAYVASQMRHALSSVSQWGMQDGLFSMADFYYNVLDLFDPPSSEWAQDTLAYWN
ncbi:hypothetical protein DXG01_006244, partial [Tephrocybe rancida]